MSNKIFPQRQALSFYYFGESIMTKSTQPALFLGSTFGWFNKIIIFVLVAFSFLSTAVYAETAIPIEAQSF